MSPRRMNNFSLFFSRTSGVENGWRLAFRGGERRVHHLGDALLSSGSNRCPEAPASWPHRCCITGRTFPKRQLPTAGALAFTPLCRDYLAFRSPLKCPPLECATPTPSSYRASLYLLAGGTKHLPSMPKPPQLSWETLAGASFHTPTQWRMGETRTFFTSLPLFVLLRQIAILTNLSPSDLGRLTPPPHKKEGSFESGDLTGGGGRGF